MLLVNRLPDLELRAKSVDVSAMQLRHVRPIICRDDFIAETGRSAREQKIMLAVSG